MGKLFVAFSSLALLAAVAFAADADPINDYCASDLKSMHPIMNGLVCKSSEDTTVADFLFTGFEKTPVVPDGGIAITPAFAGVNYPGLNTQGLSLARIDFDKGGLVPIHTHPRATEVLYLVRGSLYVGFVDTANKLFATTMKAGDVFVFPRGLVHFQLETGKGTAMSISSLNAQNPGVQLIAPSLFGSMPGIKNAVLEKGFGISSGEVDEIKRNFKPKM